MKLFEAMNIPRACVVGNTVFKKQFYENADLSRTDRDLFIEQIDKIIWAYCLKPETINIPPYKDDEREYPEIEIIEAVVTGESKTRRIAEIIMRTIPYPTLLLFQHGHRIQLYVAHQRTSLADSTRNTIEEFISTDWIDLGALSENDEKLFKSLDIAGLSFTNYYRFYSDIVDRLITYNASRLSGTYADASDVAELKARMDKIAALDKQLADLRAKLRKETQLNRCVTLNVEIKRIEKIKSDLVGGLAHA